MYSFQIQIADCVLRIKSSSKLSRKFFLDFLSDSEPDTEIFVSEDDISVKNSVFGPNLERLGWEGWVDTSKILQKVADELIQYNTFLIHGAAIAVENAAYIFIAPSGTGKTTHIMKWLEQGKDTVVINGDKPFIKITDEHVPLVFSSPWAGKEGLYTNTAVLLKAIVILKRAEENKIEPITFIEAFPELLHQIYRPDDVDKMRMTLGMIKQLQGIKLYRFHCNNFRDDCFAVAYNALIGERNE